MKIVVVEDDINMRKSLEIALGEFQEFHVKTYKSATEALKKMDPEADLVITDINMPGMDGIEFVKALDGKHDVIVITGNATLNRAIESVRLGVKDFLTKPFEIDTLVEAITRNAKLRERVKAHPVKEAVEKPEGFLATSSALSKAIALAQKAAKTDASVLLLGESGVGKELFARYIHTHSPRCNGPFVALNMAAIPENLLESELFGFEKGAFTDANATKKGQFELAQGGTLFLDEIGEMPASLQAKLLRVIQQREVMRLGGGKPQAIDVRIISATNADILEKIASGAFREDVYYRLNTIPLCIPPLRERLDEIAPISQAVLARVSQEYGLGEKTLSEAAKTALLEYPWPGNIRELISVIERAAILSDGVEIECEDLFLESRQSGKKIDTMEKELIKEVLASVQYDKIRASELLGMGQGTLETKCQKYNL
ncbi:MAG: sigma-54-dependent Fis family transcriptional regulator [Campylobacterales bacterium]|nr:sigma-54-dependent Fis family transcriptional regulator [Campylobacterales bacterium]